jgi:hypothetical protein
LDIQGLLGEMAQPAGVLRRFHALETLRLDACIARDLPGLHRDMVALRQELDEPAPFRLRRVESDGLPDGFRYALQLGEQPVDPPADVRGVMASILQDLGEIPPDYLTAAGPGAYPPQSPPGAGRPR